ncbi:MAG: hypothetical protein Q9207_002556 [Kuettlingeria erythrocarpa]
MSSLQPNATAGALAGSGTINAPGSNDPQHRTFKNGTLSPSVPSQVVITQLTAHPGLTTLNRNLGLVHLSTILPFPYAIPAVGEPVPEWIRELASRPNTSTATVMWGNPYTVPRPEHRFYPDIGFYQLPSGHWLKFDLEWGLRHEFNLILRDDPGARFLDGIGTLDVEALYHQLQHELSFSARQLIEQGRSEPFMEQVAAYPQHRAGILHLSACLPFPYTFPKVGEPVPQWIRNLAAIPNTAAVTVMWEEPREVRRPDHRFYSNMVFYQMPNREWLIFHMDTGKRARDFNLVLRNDPGIGYMEGLGTYDVGALYQALRRRMEMCAQLAQTQLQAALDESQRIAAPEPLEGGPSQEDHESRLQVPVNALNTGPSSQTPASGPQAPQKPGSTGEKC